MESDLFWKRNLCVVFNGCDTRDNSLGQISVGDIALTYYSKLVIWNQCFLLAICLLHSASDNSFSSSPTSMSSLQDSIVSDNLRRHYCSPWNNNITFCLFMRVLYPLKSENLKFHRLKKENRLGHASYTSWAFCWINQFIRRQGYKHIFFLFFISDLTLKIQSQMFSLENWYFIY